MIARVAVLILPLAACAGIVALAYLLRPRIERHLWCIPVLVVVFSILPNLIPIYMKLGRVLLRRGRGDLLKIFDRYLERQIKFTSLQVSADALVAKIFYATILVLAIQAVSTSYGFTLLSMLPETWRETLSAFPSAAATLSTMILASFVHNGYKRRCDRERLNALSRMAKNTIPKLRRVSTLQPDDQNTIINDILNEAIKMTEFEFYKHSLRWLARQCYPGRPVGDKTAWLFVPDAEKDVFRVSTIIALDGSNPYEGIEEKYFPIKLRLDKWQEAALEYNRTPKERKLFYELHRHEFASDIGFVFEHQKAEMVSWLKMCELHVPPPVGPLPARRTAAIGLRSAVLLPVSCMEGSGGGNALAVLAVFSPSPCEFNAVDVQWLSWYALLLGAVLSAARGRDEVLELIATRLVQFLEVSTND